MNKPNSAEDYKLLTSFYEVRKTLLNCGHTDRLEKPLAYWALPSDRRLPLALLGRTVKDLLDTPFDQLAATPGIGRKKIHALVNLLDRASNGDVAGSNENRDAPSSTHNDNGRKASDGDFDADTVSEVVWERWKETVRKHNLASERLGRLAPALSEMPTVIWDTPLAFYLDYSVAEIRHLKTHGEKRVRSVLQVFWSIDHTLAESAHGSHLSVQLAPRVFAELKNWIALVLAGDETPDLETIKERFVDPLLNQIQVDGGQAVHDLVAGRLGITIAKESVRSQSRKMGVTRARVYQLLDDCAKIASVRWPEGESSLAQFSETLKSRGAEPAVIQVIDDFCGILYPAAAAPGS